MTWTCCEDMERGHLTVSIQELCKLHWDSVKLTDVWQVTGLDTHAAGGLGAAVGLYMCGGS